MASDLSRCQIKTDRSWRTSQADLTSGCLQMLRVEGMEAFAEERDREVRNILQSINDLGQVMKDLSVLVIDQGTILDRIDANMDQVGTAARARCQAAISCMLSLVIDCSVASQSLSRWCADIIALALYAPGVRNLLDPA